MSAAREFAQRESAPHPDRAWVLSPELLDEAYRLAVCLTADDRRAARICVRAIRGLGLRGVRMTASLIRWILLRRVLGEGRALWPETPPFRPSEAVCDLRALPVAEREVLALRLACDLSEGERAEVLRVPLEEVRTLHERGRQLLMVGREPLPPSSC